MIKFTLKSDGIKSNIHDLILKGSITNSGVVDAFTYQLKLSRWWEYKYNSDQPRKITNITK